ncbi:hypothetical protein HHI36_008897 [Cryptolaemus montrouzieri]|uniref:Uncharacterized protein n=1 Tax=Cryptolaemus montrouzieri TaxID=559131 RepID=A0ABD2MUG6_9CUCU
MTKALLFITILGIFHSCVTSEDEVANCMVYKATTFCFNTTNISDPEARSSMQILRTSGVIKEDLFPKMYNVRAIEFVSNNLTEIEPRFFMKFPNLNRLIIRGNDRFPNITKELLKHCKKLVNLKIYFNLGLNHVDENILRNFQYLEKLVIRSERLTHLRKHDFQVAINLKTLKLDLTTLKKIDSNAFEPIGNLEKLSLMANNYLKINLEIFDFIPKLKELNLIYAEITELDFLRKLPKLEILLLAGNRIESISADTFKGLKDLKKVDLAHTHISHIDTSKQFFENVPKLESIDITCHNLTNELFDIVKFDDHNITVLDKYAGIEDRILSC